MNPLTKVKLINELNKREAELGVQEKVSWHSEYQDSAWIFLGGLPYELTEGDIICVFSQYGEIVNINLVRDKKTGKSKGFCFLCYEDQRSTVLAVDNFNGIKIKGRTIRVDHVANYRPPKESADLDEITRTLHERGCGAKTPPLSPAESWEEEEQEIPRKKHKTDKKEKKKKKKKKLKNEKLEPEDEYISRSQEYRIKEEKDDGTYDKYASTSQVLSVPSHSQKARENCTGNKQSVERKDIKSAHRGSVKEAERSQQREDRRKEQKDYQRNDDRCKDQRAERYKDYRNDKGHLDSWIEEDRKNASSGYREGERSRRLEKSKESQREKYEKSSLHSSRQGQSFFSSKSQSSSHNREHSDLERKDRYY
ncbi:RNA-binding motif protein, X-linked 2 [Microcaecilia unicolor]|uniref:RNA-binding motif protein, X-linked 2 n=1 Tax=Microcaecilia unicolor TaxID=1415580 RepID=A0A6P7WNE3_9AMPH|nr:RNA-binding motif protein, X-linked 2 [Microcaecilia unicolor]